LVGCDTPADSPGVVSSKFDGTYVGEMRLVPEYNRYCTPFPSPKMVIVNGRLEYGHFGNGAIIHTELRDDGTFSGSAFNRFNKSMQTVEGKVAGNIIEADTQNQYCEYHMTLNRE
jgi:hypothetical protein